MTGQTITLHNTSLRLTTADFFREMAGIPKSTVYLRIGSMVSKGAIQRVRRGIYECTNKPAFALEVREIADTITQEFPIW